MSDDEKKPFDVFEPAEKQFKEAEARFATGRAANQTGYMAFLPWAG